MSADRLLAAIFDLDGVVTFTARIHEATWKTLFDDFLRTRAERSGEPFRSFSHEDYRKWVDGRPRLDGIRTFLASRGITLPEGTPDDPAGANTVHGLARRKNDAFQERVRREGVEIDEMAVRLIRALKDRGTRVGVASSSKNTPLILEVAGLEDLFEARVDGNERERLGLPGKPAPDTFLECLRRLGVHEPARAAVFEDATSGVEAGRAGGFGLVVGVDRTGHADALRSHGADIVISDFRDLTPDRLDALLADQDRAA